MDNLAQHEPVAIAQAEVVVEDRPPAFSPECTDPIATAVPITPAPESDAALAARLQRDEIDAIATPHAAPRRPRPPSRVVVVEGAPYCGPVSWLSGLALCDREVTRTVVTDGGGVATEEVVRVQLPPNAAPGSVLSTRLADGRIINFTVPLHCQPGDQIAVRVPA